MRTRAATATVTAGWVTATQINAPTKTSSPNDAAQFVNGSGLVLIARRELALMPWEESADERVYGIGITEGVDGGHFVGDELDQVQGRREDDDRNLGKDFETVGQPDGSDPWRKPSAATVA
jgi:hypothetical protein